MNSKIFQLMGIGLVLIQGSSLESMAQTGVRPLNKQEAVALALNQNFGIQLAQKRAELASVNTGWGAAGALPQIGVSTTASSTVSDQRENPTSFIQERLESDALNASAQLNWTLFDGMRMFANKQALDVLAEQAEGQVNLVVEQTVVAVLMAYDDVLIQLAVEEVLRNSLAVSADRLSRLETAQEWGGARAFDRLQIQNALFTDSLALIQQGLSREVAMHNFSRLLGGSEWSDWKLTSPLDSPVENGGWDAVKSAVLSDATAIRNAMLSRELADVGIAQAESGLFPMVQLSSSFGDQRSTFAAGDLSGEGRTQNLAANLSLNFKFSMAEPRVERFNRPKFKWKLQIWTLRTNNVRCCFWRARQQIGWPRKRPFISWPSEWHRMLLNCLKWGGTGWNLERSIPWISVNCKSDCSGPRWRCSEHSKRGAPLNWT